MGREQNQEFKIKTITRASIATEINNHIDIAQFTGQNELTPDDDRLTDELCQNYADFLRHSFEITNDEDDQALAEHEYLSGLLIELGFTHPDDE